MHDNVNRSNTEMEMQTIATIKYIHTLQYTDIYIVHRLAAETALIDLIQFSTDYVKKFLNCLRTSCAVSLTTVET